MLVWVNEIVKAKNEKLFISENGWLISRKFEGSNRFPFGEWIPFWGGPTDVLPNFGPCGFCIFSTRLTINLVYAVRNMVVSCSLRAPAMSFRMWKDKETTRKWQATYEYLIRFRHLFRSVFVRFAIFFCVIDFVQSFCWSFICWLRSRWSYIIVITVNLRNRPMIWFCWCEPGPYESSSFIYGIMTKAADAMWEDLRHTRKISNEMHCETQIFGWIGCGLVIDGVLRALVPASVY